MLPRLQRLVPAVRGAAAVVAGVEIQVLVGGDEGVRTGAVTLLQGRVQALVPPHANLAKVIRKLVRHGVEGVLRVARKGVGVWGERFKRQHRQHPQSPNAEDGQRVPHGPGVLGARTGSSCTVGALLP